ncbi:Fusarisetin A cluster transcription factor fsa6 [Colletotrichum gloeosporioides]|uniref:Fusarisetin A cluster transcription factor fsa6 n=1 Tax=Colletotrichum gloeosporioides TaxID=474922 RepID=A0A8H4CPL7_COLGL|nr:Fusarisetin A cluster transcription factor fsa6 [Colletotrichum gloeosporioides]KAF3807744.1 Fusarisetin A cluster transcription factor fsa6 [Colletotrichum gloeosporioides]
MTTDPGEIAQRPRPIASRRRDKPQLSCNLCRRRKLRCDRKKPCFNCSTRGQSCVYAENSTMVSASTESSNDATLQDRLSYLERLVMTISPEQSLNKLNESAHPTRNAAIDKPIDDSSETGSLRTGAADHQYVSGDHWAAILDSIADLRDHFNREEQFRAVESPGSAVGPIQDVGGNAASRSFHPRRALLLYGCKPARCREEILSALPPKSTVDRYVSRYFNHLDLVASCECPLFPWITSPLIVASKASVHGPTFIQDYEAFWANTSSASIMWIGLLYSMICLALIASDTNGSVLSRELTDHDLDIEAYREKVVQCLIMGEYTNGGTHTLETFMNYVYIEFRIHEDAEKDVWFLLGIEVNLAKRMGYHRDPKHFPGITPLEGEMRRRVWATVLLGDSLISGQMGMPRMITSDQFDTEEPRNLNDSDLEEAITELPPPRPETEHTTALGIIARRRILIALGAVSDLTSSLKPSGYTEYMRVDKILNDAKGSIPPPLQPKSMASSVTDSPQTIMARLFLSHIYCKGQIMLHRRFLFTESLSPSNDLFAYSREACVNAALETLRIQKILNEETRPGGQLHIMQWRVGSLMNHHFLTATMILCSVVHRKRPVDRDEEIMEALRSSRAIWMTKSQHSKEAKKAAQAISIVLARAGGPRFDMELMSRSMEEMPMETTSSHEKGDLGETGMGWDDDRWLEEALHLRTGEIRGECALHHTLTGCTTDFSVVGASEDHLIPGQNDASMRLGLENFQEGVNIADWILLNDGNT